MGLLYLLRYSLIAQSVAHLRTFQLVSGLITPNPTKVIENDKSELRNPSYKPIKQITGCLTKNDLVSYNCIIYLMGAHTIIHEQNYYYMDKLLTELSSLY